MFGFASMSLAGAATADVSAKKQSKKKKTSKKKRTSRNKLKKAPKPNANANFTARGSVGDAYVEDATPGIKLLLVNRYNRIVTQGKADSFGSKIFYDQKMGPGYRVFSRKGNQVAETRKFQILKIDQNPPASFYKNKPLHEGLNYVTMRDGVELAMTVRLPSGKDLSDGPFPTFIEHSGYQTAAPHDLFNSLLGGASDPLAPASSTAVGSIIGPLLNFATVSVQMRGSGCSGGAFDLFGLPTTFDGYDMVEMVGNQGWVQNGKVGLAGISFSGISQLFAAGTQPPHLAAISPMSVTDDLYTGTGFPGGIFNKGFAKSWILARMRDAEPAPEGGQTWAKIMATTGDPDSADSASQVQHCIDNQKLRLQTRDAIKQQEKNPYRTPNLFKYRAPGYWVSRINVPTMWIGQFQDEQTGGHFPESISKLDKNKNVWIALQNGVHVDSLGPSTITDWNDFMNLFVADRIPKVPGLVLGFSALLYNEVADAAAKPVQQSKYAEYTDVGKARSDFKKNTPRVRLMMDNGDGVEGVPGAIGSAWEMGYSSWPVKEAKANTFFLGKNGALSRAKPGKAGKLAYKADPSARPPQTLNGAGESDAWVAEPPYEWAPLANGKGLGFTGQTLTKDVIMAGPSSLDLWLRSTAKDTDLQATISEVRPDGKETYVQNGFLRASHRKLNRKLSTAIDPFPTHLKRDARPLSRKRYSLVRVPIFPVAHAFRAGSKIRITVQAVGGDRPIWDFDTLDNGKTKNTISIGGRKASKFVLPIIMGADAQGTELPPPTALRGQPSRDYTKASNGG